MKEVVAEGFDPEVIDLISLKPFDQNSIAVRDGEREPTAEGPAAPPACSGLADAGPALAECLAARANPPRPPALRSR